MREKIAAYERYIIGGKKYNLRIRGRSFSIGKSVATKDGDREALNDSRSHGVEYYKVEDTVTADRIARVRTAHMKDGTDGERIAYDYQDQTPPTIIRGTKGLVRRQIVLVRPRQSQ